jgi:hypothetical protein
MDEEIIQRLENLEQRINLLQASIDSLAVSVSLLLFGQSLQTEVTVTPPLSEKQRREMVLMHLRAYQINQKREDSRLSEWPFLPPEPPPPGPPVD